MGYLKITLQEIVEKNLEKFLSKSKIFHLLFSEVI